MGGLRWTIIIAGQISALILIICITATGAIIGYSISKGLTALQTLSMYDALQVRDPGLWIGGFVGLVSSVLIAAIFFTLVEIAKNTSEHWFQ